MNIPLLALIFQGIPELTGVVTLAFVIKRAPLQWTKIIPIALVLAVVSYIIRRFPLPFGLHTIFIIFLLFLFLNWIGEKDISMSLLASLLSLLAVILFETISLSILMPLFGITSETMLTDSYTRIMIAEPQVVLLFITSYLLHRLLPNRSERNESG